jgi:hypothetical protein
LISRDRVEWNDARIPDYERQATQYASRAPYALTNCATAGNQSAQAAEEGLEPTEEWMKDLIDEIIAEEFSSPDLELHWLDEDADPAATEAALEGRVKLGAVTLNEMRNHLGLDPYANPAANRPMVLTPTGYCRSRQGFGSTRNADQIPLGNRGDCESVRFPKR